jgi:drug/metabolite transporter (DMT)-like permease
MNLDELIAVWKSQDAAPLHDVNQTLLHQALRQDETKRLKYRRIERWLIYVFSAGFVAGLALFLANMILLMIHRDDRNGLTGWDLAIPVVGALAALISGRAMYVRHRVQALREQSFGESLRDQLNRSIAQLNYQATTLHRTLMLVIVLLTGICPIALLLALSRLNKKSFSDDGYLVVWLSVMCVCSVATAVWSIRQQTRDVVLPHKRRLEALLKELDGQ